MNVLVLTTLVVCLAYACWPAIRLVRNEPVIFVQLKWLIAPLALLIAMCAVTLFAKPAAVDGVLIWGYLITALLILPAAGVWAFVDRTRWSSAVLLIGAVAVAVMVLRIGQIWGLM